jgi:hypothetical protein
MRSKVHTDLFKNRLGYYKVGDSVVRNAHLALIEASRKQQPLEWEFNSSVYKSIDWTKPIDIPLDTLYAMRLQQLRNEYDHLVLYFSGGKDSLNILLTAINNNIFIDEIVMFYPFPVEKTFNKDDLSSDNMFAEVEFAAKPLLEKYRNKIPSNTVIRYSDLAEPNIRACERDDWFDLYPVHIAFTVKNRTTMIGNDPVLLDHAAKGKHVGLIFGVDKPRVQFDGKSYSLSFPDIPFQAFNEPMISDQKELFSKHIHYEPFYWTPFFPEVVIKQAQVIAAAAEASPNIKHLLSVRHYVGMGFITHRERVIADVIYSDGEHMWQTIKPKPIINRKLDDWFWDIAPQKVKDNFADVIRIVKNQVDMKFFMDGEFEKGKRPSLSGNYIIKTLGEQNE